MASTEIGGLGHIAGEEIDAVATDRDQQAIAALHTQGSKLQRSMLGSLNVWGIPGAFYDQGLLIGSQGRSDNGNH